MIFFLIQAVYTVQAFGNDLFHQLESQRQAPLLSTQIKIKSSTAFNITSCGEPFAKKRILKHAAKPHRDLHSDIFCQGRSENQCGHWFKVAGGVRQGFIGEPTSAHSDMAFRPIGSPASFFKTWDCGSPPPRWTMAGRGDYDVWDAHRVLNVHRQLCSLCLLGG